MSSEAKLSAISADRATDAGAKTVFKVLLAISFCHLLNDTVQSLLPAIYPLLRDTFHLDFGQIGLISFTSTFTASLLQPLVGLYSDRHHKPYFLAIGMAITLIGLVTLSLAPSYATVLVAAALVGMGSSVFHPESSRVARMASGGQHGMAHRCSRSEATQDRHWGRCWRRLYCRAGNEASPGFRSWRCWG